MPSTEALVTVLGGMAVFRRKIHTLDDMTAAIRQGMPFPALKTVALVAQLDLLRMAHVLRIPPRTLAQPQQQGRLSPDESDRLTRFARIVEMAHEMFDDSVKVARWLQRPNRALRNVAPLDLLDTDIGTQAVETTLGRLGSGVYS